MANSTFITGANGFTSRFLQKLVAKGGGYVCGIDVTATGTIQERDSETSSRAVVCDIRDALRLADVLRESPPIAVYHLAAVLKAPRPQDFIDINVVGTLNLMECLAEQGIKPRLLLPSSSAVYGPGHGGLPITEDFTLRPVTHYGVSKVGQETVAFRYFHSHQIPVICARTFNLLGPGLPDSMACSAFAKQIVSLEKRGEPGSMEVGNLDALRDFTDVRDAARAYVLLMGKGRPGSVYNVCSESAVRIGDCLEILLKAARVKITIRKAPERFQVNDVPKQVGCAARLRQLTGWQPQISVEQSLLDLLDYWRKRV